MFFNLKTDSFEYINCDISLHIKTRYSPSVSNSIVLNV